ncbi:hypothetical protein ACLOJK_024743 [Asimina triloba]
MEKEKKKQENGKKPQLYGLRLDSRLSLSLPSFSSAINTACEKSLQQQPPSLSMGKTEEEQALATPAAAAAASEENAAPPRCRIWRSVRFRCIAALVLGVAVLLSAIFWLPPFLNSDRERRDHYGGEDREFELFRLRHCFELLDFVRIQLNAIASLANLVIEGFKCLTLDKMDAPSQGASFKLQKSVSLLQDNIVNLENDIFEEIGVGNSMVLIESLEPLAGSNRTNVVFGVWPYEKNSTISSAGLSILRSYFVSFVVHQPNLHLGPLFGDPSSFQVLKFPGGITVIPPQSGFPLQKGQVIFNFTLNFCIDQIQGIFDELQYQLKSGLHLTQFELHKSIPVFQFKLFPYLVGFVSDIGELHHESHLFGDADMLLSHVVTNNLYLKLTNLRGSTVDPPIIVQASVLLAVRDLHRLRQLVQDIRGSPARNLGLNHTVFGKVKQIRLSSTFENTTNGSNGNGISSSPSPAPSPHPNHRRRRRRHHHHQHHRPDVELSPAPAPAPQYNYRSPSPSPCQYQFPREPSASGSIPTVAPTVPPRPFFTSPPMNGDPPAPVSDSSPSSSPLPAVVLGHSQPPSKITAHIEPPDATPSVPPLPSSCFVCVLQVASPAPGRGQCNKAASADNFTLSMRSEIQGA